MRWKAATAIAMLLTGPVLAKDMPPLPAPPPPDDAALLAAADPAAGERQWRQCRACHALEPGRHGVGPSLHGIVGAPIAAQDWGRPYSMTLREMGATGAVWDVARLTAFLDNPRGFAPGTAMAYAGLRNPEDRLNLVAYLAREGR